MRSCVLALALVIGACGGCSSDVPSSHAAGGRAAEGGAAGSPNEPAGAAGVPVELGQAGGHEPEGGAAGMPPTEPEGGAGFAGEPSSVGGTGGSAAGSGGVGARAGSNGGGAGGSSHAFTCPDPKPDDGIGWTQYVVQPGHCLIVGSSTWSGEQVCRETSPKDGTCNATCKNYLSVRVGLFDEPVEIAVMPLFGTVLELDSETDGACSQAPTGIRPN